MAQQFDVVVVGSSVAGATLSIILARKGLAVALVDKSDFPRAKSCGEGLSPQGRKVLHAMGLADHLTALPHHVISGYQLAWGRAVVEVPFIRKVETSPSADEIKGMGISRYHLDHLLAHTARNSINIKTYFSTTIKEISLTSHSAQVHTAQDIISAKYLVLADGVNSNLAPRLGVPLLYNNRSRYGCTLSVSGEYLNDDTFVRIFLRPRYQLFCTPIGAHTMNVTLLGSKNIAANFGNKTFLAEALSSIQSLCSFRGEIINNTQATGPLGWQRRVSHFRNIILIGDSCEHLDPIGGMGMTHALQSAQLAARCLQSILIDKCEENTAFEIYDRAREQLVRPLRGFTRLTYLSLVTLDRFNVSRLLLKAPVARAIGQAVHGSDYGSDWMRLFSNSLLHAAGLQL